MAKEIRNWPIKNRADPNGWLTKILAWGQSHQVNDFYFLPGANDYVLKGQVKGRLELLDQLDNEFAQRVLAVIKYRADLNLAENRRPQLGRFDFEKIFVRVSTVGDFLGHESAVLRLVISNLSHLRWFDDGLWQDLIKTRPGSGLYVLAGPTGAGKTSTLYRLLEDWSVGQVVLTVEDPVEIYRSQYLQLQVNDQAGIDYQALIKVALRHRPDILVIGEIRDFKTAQAALQAALSGHLVLTTVHANSELAVLDRLEDLGLDRQLVGQALVKTVYQQLLVESGGGLAVVAGVASWQAGQVVNHLPYEDGYEKFIGRNR
ncbi:ATPase, T2SS/T4P/T4SS family [Fructobacillus ficulneus]|uniref:ComG operon protein 1 n=1 Tax=Fructobacillus ficulneus TaxID=157463 RepID=A0A0K8MHB6_9LACO|nr:ATPase, T2SS/T4P/T4SS family [Fructobacillus ficulneus]GAO99563.1 ComG operon protein 1 [Fructobacillus ficulneus]